MLSTHTQGRHSKAALRAESVSRGLRGPSSEPLSLERGSCPGGPGLQPAAEFPSARPKEKASRLGVQVTGLSPPSLPRRTPPASSEVPVSPRPWCSFPHSSPQPPGRPRAGFHFLVRAAHLYQGAPGCQGNSRVFADRSLPSALHFTSYPISCLPADCPLGGS